METTEVEVIDLKAELQVFDPVAAQIAEMKEKNANLAFDYDDKQGNKEARSWIAVLRKLKKPITETHKLAKAEAKKFCDALDGKKKELLGVVEEMIEYHHKPIWEIEQKEIAKRAEIELKKREAEEAKQEEARLELEAREKAVADKEAAIEKEKAEIEVKAREARAALDAKKEAEYQAARALEAAENKRIADVQAAENKAKAEAAEKDRKLAEGKRLAEILRANEEKAERQRRDNLEHRKQIHKEIYETLQHLMPPLAGCPVDIECSKRICLALINKEIPHVTIQY